MDDDAAEIELLEQNLHKTRQISQRMVSILSSFDSRLGKLEKSIQPLYTTTQLLTRRSRNVEAALVKIDEVASNQEGIAAEEALILRGPQEGQLGVYKETLERLNASIALNTSDREPRETARLVETGAKKIAGLYTRLVSDSASIETIRPVVTMLRGLPVPATHPTHPAAPAILAALKDAQRAYADSRGAAAVLALAGSAQAVLGRAETDDGVTVGRLLGVWVDDVIAAAEHEYANLRELAPLPNPAQVATTFGTVLTPLLATFNTTLGSLLALVKRSLGKHAFLALGSFGALSSAQTRWDAALAPAAGRRDKDELRDALTQLRALCLRSFPELLADLKVAAIPRPGAELGTSTADVTVSAVSYLDKLADVKSAAGVALLALGDGNWRMGEGLAVAKGPKLGEGDEVVVLEHYIHDVVNTTLTSLTALSKTARRGPPFGSVFLLNNVFFLEYRLTAGPLGALLAKPTRALLTSNSRIAKAGYFDANFSPLMQALADEPVSRGALGVGPNTKTVMKDKYTRFFDLLEEVAERHKIAKVLEDDEDGREQIGEEVVKLVVPSLQRFTQKTKEKEFSKNPQKYIKMTPDAVEAQIRSFYQ